MTLPPELQRFVEDKVRAGQYASAEEVVRGALAMLRDQEELSAAELADLRRDVREGLDQLDRGDGEAWDVERAKAALKAKFGGR